MITLYRTFDRSLYLYVGGSTTVWQLEPGTAIALVEKAIAALSCGKTPQAKECAFAEVREKLHDLFTDACYRVGKDKQAFLRTYIGWLERDVKCSQLPHPMEGEALEQLKSVLDELSAMPALAPFGAEQSDEAYEERTRQSERLHQLLSNAYQVASWTASNPVRDVLTSIRKTYHRKCGS